MSIVATPKIFLAANAFSILIGVLLFVFYIYTFYFEDVSGPALFSNGIGLFILTYLCGVILIIVWSVCLGILYFKGQSLGSMNSFGFWALLISLLIVAIPFMKANMRKGDIVLAETSEQRRVHMKEIYEVVIDDFVASISERDQHVVLNISNLMSPTINVVLNSKHELNKETGIEEVQVEFDYQSNSTIGKPTFSRFEFVKDQKMKQIQVIIKRNTQSSQPKVVWPKQSINKIDLVKRK